MTPVRIPNQRAIVDRRALAEAIAAQVEQHGAGQARKPVVELLRKALADGRAEVARRLLEKPTAGHDCAEAQAFLVDQLVRVIHDHVVGDVYRSSNRSAGERLTIMAVGGYGRGEMAPYSDVDIAFITPNQPATVKFTAYDFSIYGGLDAKVENISPDTQVDEKGNAFYVVRVRTGQPSFGDDKPIIPGMTAEVDILTGKKTVLSYLLKPVLKAKAYALRER